MSEKEYTCHECGKIFKRDEQIQKKLYDEMGAVADQYKECIIESFGDE